MRYAVGPAERNAALCRCAKRARTAEYGCRIAIGEKSISANGILWGSSGGAAPWRTHMYTYRIIDLFGMFINSRNLVVCYLNNKRYPYLAWYPHSRCGDRGFGAFGGSYTLQYVLYQYIQLYTIIIGTSHDSRATRKPLRTAYNRGRPAQVRAPCCKKDATWPTRYHAPISKLCRTVVTHLRPLLPPAQPYTCTVRSSCPDA